MALTGKPRVFNFDAYWERLKDFPELPRASQTELEWFVGFSEGDGCWSVRDLNHPSLRPRCLYHITQADKIPLERILKFLGFGTIRLEGKYWRYSVSNTLYASILITIFNGNLILKKCFQRFEAYVNIFNVAVSKRLIAPAIAPISLIRSRREVSLDSAWLAGFAQADGGFHVTRQERTYKPGSFQWLFEFYITQNLEVAFLIQLTERIRERHPKYGTGKLRTLKTQKVRIRKDVWRMRITSFPDIKTICAYFDKFQMSGSKLELFQRWKEIFFTKDQLEEVARSGQAGKAAVEKKLKEVQLKFKQLNVPAEAVLSDSDEKLCSNLDPNHHSS